MNTSLVGAVVTACLFGTVLLGRILRRVLPEPHLSAETRDAVKLSVGLVATMAAMLLGLLINSAKGNFEAQRAQVIQMAAKTAMLDRVLSVYGPEAANARSRFRASVEDAVRRMWPAEKGLPAQLNPNVQVGDAFYVALQGLSPRDEMQRGLKAQATALAMDLAQLRSLLVAQSVSSLSLPLVTVLVCWLVVVFLGFSLCAPANATANLALLISACSVAGAVLLVCELDHPFGGFIHISSAPVLNALNEK